jgi:monoamine oxidase
VVPALRSQHGVRGAFQFVNPQSGMVFSGSLWDTQADLDKSEGANHEMREQMIQKLGGKNARTEAFEVYYTEILTPATEGGEPKLRPAAAALDARVGGRL